MSMPEAVPGGRASYVAFEMPDLSRGETWGGLGRQTAEAARLGLVRRHRFDDDVGDDPVDVLEHWNDDLDDAIQTCLTLDR